MALAQAGSELVRVTVNTEEAARAVPEIVDTLDKFGVRVPVIGDFHYNGHLLLKKYPDMARALAKYRINPGNVNIGKKHDDNFRIMIEAAIEYDRPVRIGVNWGSLDQALLTRMMDENNRLPEPLDAQDRDPARHRGQRASNRPRPPSTTGSRATDHPQREGQRRAGSDRGVSHARRRMRLCAASGPDRSRPGIEGHRRDHRGASACCLQEGIGDTIRASLTPLPNGDRTEEVIVCQQILQSLELRSFTPQVTACPGCGRTTSTFFQDMADQIQTYLREQMPVWKAALYRRRGDEGRGDGLRGERAGRIQALQSRHLAAGHVSRSRWRRFTSTASSSAPCAATALWPEFIAILNDYVGRHYAARTLEGVGA